MVLAACGSEDSGKENPGGECQVNADCPGEDNICDLLTHTCSGGSGTPDGTTTKFDTGVDDPDTNIEPDTGIEPDTFSPPEDTGGGGDDTFVSKMDSGMQDAATPDTSSPDTGSMDTSPMDTSPQDTTVADTTPADTSVTDSSVDTGKADTTTDTSSPPTFSGCTSDSDCRDYLTCNQTLGRCEDPRTKCTSDSQCSGSDVCLAGRCTSRCGVFTPCRRTGMFCKTFGSGFSAINLCVDRCNNFDGSGSRKCGSDTQCIPFFGSSAGLCRGVGRKTKGQTCKTNYGPDSCTNGQYCSSNRGNKRCVPLCSTTGSPNCGSGEYCTEVFTQNATQSTVNDPAGFCLKNCGGLGSTNNNQCSSGQACQPESSQNGYCTKMGTVNPDNPCGDPGSPYCKVGNYCMPAATTNQGTCRRLCDPSKSPSNIACKSGKVCVEIDTNFGICLTNCSSSSSQCPSERPYCGRLRTTVKTTPSATDVCFESAP